MKIIFAALFCITFWTSGALTQVAVIAHKSVPVDTIKKSELMDFYTGDIQKWSDEQFIVVFDLKPKGEVREAFYKFLGKSSSRMKSIWLKKMLSGEGEPPEFMKSEEELLKKVASTPGAIGYVNQAKVSEEVKILLAVNEVKK